MEYKNIDRDSDNLFGLVKHVKQRCYCATDDSYRWKKGEMSEPNTEVFPNFNKNYNKEGLLINYSVFQYNKMIWEQINDFKIDNQIEVSTRYKNNEAILDKNKYFYDSNNRIKEYHHFYKGHYNALEIRCKHYFNYSLKGDLQEESIIYTRSPRFNYIIRHEYFTEGHLKTTVRKHIFRDGVRDKFVDKFDKDGNLIVSEYSNSESLSIQRFSYDNLGNVIKSEYDNNGSSKYTYSFDEGGNWIEKKVLNSDNNLEHKITREIEYWQ